MATSDVVDAGALAAARLDPAASLAVFRALVGAASRPGRVTGIELPQTGDSSHRPPTVLLPALALIDLDHVFAVLDGPDADQSATAALVAAATGARPTDDLGDADVVVAVRPPTVEEVLAMRRGSAHEPELGARLIASCRGIVTDESAAVPRIGLRGPGVPESGRVVAVDGVPLGVFDALASANAAFPAGIDTWFVADDGSVVAVPRSSTIEQEEN